MKHVAARRFTRAELVALLAAVLCSSALIVAAATIPFYSSSTSEQTSSGTVVTQSSGSATLVETNGLFVLGVVAIPLLATGLIALILWLRRPEYGASALAWTIVALLGVLTLAGMLTIGPFILPTTASLAVACAIRHARRQTPPPPSPTPSAAP